MNKFEQDQAIQYIEHVEQVQSVDTFIPQPHEPDPDLSLMKEFEAFLESWNPNGPGQ